MAANARERFAHAERLSRKDDEIARLRALNAELVELNAELVAALEEHVRDFGDNEDDDSQRMRDKALAVLAKARGKT